MAMEKAIVAMVMVMVYLFAFKSFFNDDLTATFTKSRFTHNLTQSSNTFFLRIREINTYG